MKKSYNDKVAIITGGARGLGEAITEKFAQDGYNVIINYNNSEEKARKLKNKIENKYPVRATIIKADVSKEEEIISLLNQVKEEYKQIDCLINNAAIAIDTTLEDKTVDNFKKIIDINLIGTFITCKHIGTYMKEQGYGSIVNISSTNGIDSYYPYSMDYDASKAGVISLTHNFAIEYAPNVRVNCVAPGWIKTDMNKELSKEYIESECEHILLQRFSEPEEIADSVYFAATNTYLNDSILKIDGGVNKWYQKKY